MDNEANVVQIRKVPFTSIYTLQRRLLWAIAGITIGIIIAGLWNYKLVDNFGNAYVAGHTIGSTKQLANTFGQNGLGFGFIFAGIAGLAATFTACNCVVFAMIPGLAYADRSLSAKSALRALTVFAMGVLAVCALFGYFVGSLGSDGIKAFTSDAVRIHRAQFTFTAIGIVMVIWGAITFGFLNRIIAIIPAKTRRFLENSLTKAGIMGIMVGLFTIGRPFPVFRDFLVYAATSDNPHYGAIIMCLQGVGQIAFMVVLFLIMIFVFGKKLQRWTTRKPYQPELVSSLALFIGGAYFIFYWGIAITYNIGSWGFKMGWYH